MIAFVIIQHKKLSKNGNFWTVFGIQKFAENEPV